MEPGSSRRGVANSGGIYNFLIVVFPRLGVFVSHPFGGPGLVQHAHRRVSPIHEVPIAIRNKLVYHSESPCNNRVSIGRGVERTGKREAMFTIQIGGVLAVCAGLVGGQTNGPQVSVRGDGALVTQSVRLGLPSSLYSQDVPEHLRSLISVEQYTATLLQMRAIAGKELGDASLRRIAASPCSESLVQLVLSWIFNPRTRAAMNAVVDGLQPLPEYYGTPNPWMESDNSLQLLIQMIEFFGDWCEFLPQTNGSHDNGLAFIQAFAWMYYHNDAGVDFVQGRDPNHEGWPLPIGESFVMNFTVQRGAFMDSPASMVCVPEWIADPRTEIEDYQLQHADDFNSWNEFFSRVIIMDPGTETIPSRPATMPPSEYPDRDYIVSAPTDVIVNPLLQVLTSDGEAERSLVDNPLQANTIIDIKGVPVSVADMLHGVPEKYAEQFVGGSGLSCVLMPNTYHNFHAPVSGTIVHAGIVTDGAYGYSDFANWAPTDGNPGRAGTDFSQFQNFQRGVIVIEVKYANIPGASPAELTGYVALVPVGLNTISSVVLSPECEVGAEVKRGYTRLGNFLYGGSLNILLFSEGLVDGASIKCRLGTQITMYDIGSAPPADVPRGE